ncbi:MAG: carbohydrate-binding protein, partial [Bacillota bacterium]|nr:carbohydrate-binding protein [Bacillota bacterium]
MSSFSRKIKTFLSLTIGISLLVSSVFLTNVFGQTLYPESTGSSTSADAQFYFYVKPNLNFDYYTNPVAYSGFNISIVDKTNNEIISKAVSDESGYASIKDSYEKYKGKIFDVLITKKNYLKRILSSVTFEPVTYFGRIENPVEMYPGDIEISGVQDNAINMIDVIQIAKCFGTARGDINYDLNCDLDMDKIISMTDVIAIAKHFGISGYPKYQPNYNTPTPKPTYTPTPTAWAHADSRPVSVEAESTIFGTYIGYKGSYITDCDDGEYVIIPVTYGCGCGSAATINSFEVNAAVPDDKAGSMIEVRLGSKNGPLLGTLTLKSTGGRQNYSVQKTDLQVITNYQSYKSIFLVFRGNNNIADFDKFSLLVSSKSTITPAPTTPTATTSTPTPVPTNPNNVVLKAVAYDDMSNIKNNGDTIICYNNSWIEFKNV